MPFDAILTTNYTYELESEIFPSYPSLSKKTKLKYALDTRSGHDPVYLVHTYNSISPAPDIWHIHGELRRPSSIVLTHDEYARHVQAITQYIANLAIIENGGKRYNFGSYSLNLNSDNKYIKRDDPNLNYIESFSFDCDSTLDCIVYYKNFTAEIVSKISHYKNRMTDNECMSEVLKICGGGFGAVDSFTAYSLGYNKYLTISNNGYHEKTNTTYMNAFLVHKRGIIEISANCNFKNDDEKGEMLDFILGILDDVVALQSLPDE